MLQTAHALGEGIERASGVAAPSRLAGTRDRRSLPLFAPSGTEGYHGHDGGDLPYRTYI